MIELKPYVEGDKIELGRRLLLKRKNVKNLNLRHPYVIGHMKRHPNNYKMFINDFSGAEVRNITDWAYLD